MPCCLTRTPSPLMGSHGLFFHVLSPSIHLPAAGAGRATLLGLYVIARPCSPVRLAAIVNGKLQLAVAGQQQAAAIHTKHVTAPCFQGKGGSSSAGKDGHQVDSDGGNGDGKGGGEGGEGRQGEQPSVNETEKTGQKENLGGGNGDGEGGNQGADGRQGEQPSVNETKKTGQQVNLGGGNGDGERGAQDDGRKGGSPPLNKTEGTGEQGNLGGGNGHGEGGDQDDGRKVGSPPLHQSEESGRAGQQLDPQGNLGGGNGDGEDARMDESPPEDGREGGSPPSNEFEERVYVGPDIVITDEELFVDGFFDGEVHEEFGRQGDLDGDQAASHVLESGGEDQGVLNGADGEKDSGRHGRLDVDQGVSRQEESGNPVQVTPPHVSPPRQESRPSTPLLYSSNVDDQGGRGAQSDKPDDQGDRRQESREDIPCPVPLAVRYGHRGSPSSCPLDTEEVNSPPKKSHSSSSEEAHTPPHLRRQHEPGLDLLISNITSNVELGRHGTNDKDQDTSVLDQNASTVLDQGTKDVGDAAIETGVLDQGRQEVPHAAVLTSKASDAAKQSRPPPVTTYTRTRSRAASKASDSRVPQSKPDVPPAAKKKGVQKSPPKKGAAKEPAKKKGRKGANTSRDFGWISNEQQARRDAHEAWLVSMREQVDRENELVKSSASFVSDPSEVAPAFPEDSDEDFIRCSQSVPLRLTPEDEQQFTFDMVGHNEYQRKLYNCVAPRLKKRPKKLLSPFQVKSIRPNVPLAKAFALRKKIAEDEKYKNMPLIELTPMTRYYGNDVLSTFADNAYGDSAFLDVAAVCLRFDDIVHKTDSFGYRVFFTTGVHVALRDVVSIYEEDKKTETELFRRLCWKWCHYCLTIDFCPCR